MSQVMTPPGVDRIPQHRAALLLRHTNDFFEIAVDALVHVPFARTTFDEDLTAQFETHMPVAMRAWHDYRQQHHGAPEEALITSARPSAAARVVIHLPLVNTIDELPTLQWTSQLVRTLVMEVERHRYESIAIHAMQYPAMHGQTFMGFLEAAFAGVSCMVVVFERALLTIAG